MEKKTFGSVLKHAWNSIFNKDPTYEYYDTGITYTYRPDRVRLSRGNDRSILTSIYNRIALDVASMDFKHCYLDDENRYKSTINSRLNTCLTLEANIDQTGRSLMQDIVMSMLDEGCVAVVPIETYTTVKDISSFDIGTMRTAKILEWMPKHVKVRIYNDNVGKYEDRVLPKKNIAIIENPLYAVINERNSTTQRLKRKLSLLDVTDEQTASGKMDLIIQLPYVVRNESKRKIAEQRRKDIEEQLVSSKYGIAYTDGTEKITQLNRSLENNLMSQVEYLTKMVFSQLGMTQEILDGTANNDVMTNYYNRSIEPIVSAITDEFKRKFLSKNARSRGQSICAFREPFKLISVTNMAEIADKFTRNEIMTSNEIRQKIGMKPSDDPKADQLVNSNLNQPESVDDESDVEYTEEPEDSDYEDSESSESTTNFMDIPISQIR